MIKSWTVENFKSISESKTLDFAPLTIFAGANSSGKSTVIQSILLVTQTLQNSASGRCVVLNGSIVKLGAFKDIKNNKSEGNCIKIGFDIMPIRTNFNGSRPYQKFAYLPDAYVRRVDHIHCCFSFSADDPEGKDRYQLHPQLEYAEVDVVNRQTEKGTRTTDEFRAERRKEPIEKILKAEGINDFKPEVLSQPVFNNLVIKPKVYNPPGYLETNVSAAKPISCHMQHFLPRYIAFSYNKVESISNSALSSLLPRSSYRDEMENGENSFDFIKDNPQLCSAILGTLEAVVQEIKTSQPIQLRRAYGAIVNDFCHKNWRLMLSRLGIEGRRALTQRLGETEFVEQFRRIIEEQFGRENGLEFGQLPQNLEHSTTFIDAYFSGYVKYLGPLRDEPKPIYPHGGAIDTADVGFKGEFTAAVLEMNKDIEIQYVPSSEFKKSSGSAKESLVPLSEAVLDWLQYMGVAEKFVTSDKGRLGHELRVSPVGGDALHDLTHVGVGVSQVLPILVQSLLAEKGATLIFEQPELHLHPKVQTRLADFFVSLALQNKRCIVETHSEYLINQLRFLSVKSEEDSISKLSKIYFVEKENGASVYRPMAINEFGVIANWPAGFFDESEELAAETIKASIQKKKTKKSSESGLKSN